MLFKNRLMALIESEMNVRIISFERRESGAHCVVISPFSGILVKGLGDNFLECMYWAKINMALDYPGFYEILYPSKEEIQDDTELTY